MKKVGLLGGSFDPVHKGHIALAKKALKECKLDKIYFILAYSQPFKQKHVESFENRYKLLEIAVKDFKKLEACDIERSLSQPSYTYNTVMALKNKEPDTKFVWIIGDDSLEDLDKWYKLEKLLKEIDFVVVNRNNLNSSYNFKKIDFQNSASSTKIRQGKFYYLDKNVRNKIFENKMYLKHILFQRLSEKRAKHVLRCIDVALEIGKYYNVNETDLLKATALHDISKELDKKEELKIMKEYFPEHLNLNPKIYHQYTATIIAKRDFCIFDKKILAAIASHTTGDNTSLLAMLTFVADKVERGRSYEVEDYISLCKKNIYQGFKKVKNDAEKARKKKELKISE